MLIYKTVKQKLQLDQFQRMKLETLSLEHRLYWNFLVSRSTSSNGHNFKLLTSSSGIYRNELGLTASAKSIQNTSLRMIAMIKSYRSLKKVDATARPPHHYVSHKRGFFPFMYDGLIGIQYSDDKLIINRAEHRGKNKDLISLQLSKRTLNKLVGKKIVTTTFSGKGADIYVSITYAEEIEPKPDNGRWLSIDPGVTKIVTGVTSDAQVINIYNCPNKHFEKQGDELKSKRDLKKKGSRRWKKLSASYKKRSRKMVHRRVDFQHKVSRAVIDFCVADDIRKLIIGDISTKSLSKSKAANKGLNKATQNRGTLSRFQSFLAYKAEQAGISFVKQNEAYTSKTNCLTGEIWRDMSLATRDVELLPGLTIDRDVNGAINIAQKYFSENHQGTWSAQESWVTQLSEIRLNYGRVKLN